MLDTKTVYSGGSIGTIYWLFAVIYTFMSWGFWWGILNIFIPFAPLYDLASYLIAHNG